MRTTPPAKGTGGEDGGEGAGGAGALPPTNLTLAMSEVKICKSVENDVDNQTSSLLCTSAVLMYEKMGSWLSLKSTVCREW